MGLKRSDFIYEVPEEAIAQYPSQKRSGSRLIVVDRATGAIAHRQFLDLPEYLKPGDVLVVNETKVFPARLDAIREATGAQIEVFLLREEEPDIWETLVRPGRKVRIGEWLSVGPDLRGEVLDTTPNGGRRIRFQYEGDFHQIVDSVGRVPLPPYIRRTPDHDDVTRYQSIFAEKRGAVAAPTANLHFDEAMVERLRGQGVEILPVLLHVGLGTFRAVEVEDIRQHRMDAEYYEISADAAQRLNAARAEGRRVLAVGTTAVRALESASTEPGRISASSGWTEKFIYPPYDFKIVQGLVTNFHQPGSTLLMLVCALGGRDLILKAYHEAVAQGYRFFSYGDAMLIL